MQNFLNALIGLVTAFWVILGSIGYFWTYRRSHVILGAERELAQFPQEFMLLTAYCALTIVWLIALKKAWPR